MDVYILYIFTYNILFYLRVVNLSTNNQVKHLRIIDISYFRNSETIFARCPKDHFKRLLGPIRQSFEKSMFRNIYLLNNKISILTFQNSGNFYPPKNYSTPRHRRGVECSEVERQDPALSTHSWVGWKGSGEGPRGAPARPAKNGRSVVSTKFFRN